MQGRAVGNQNRQPSMTSELRFTLSYRDVEGLLAERGLDVSYETVRRGVLNSAR